MEMDRQSLVPRGPLPEIWAAGGAVAGVGAGMAERDGSAEESSVTEQSGGSGGRRRRRDVGASVSSAAEEASHKVASTASGGNESIGCDVKRLKIEPSKDDFGESNVGGKMGIHTKTKEPNAHASQDPKQDFIHVRARRGQATDSHSLAERARREKISERMKILQDLVPGCNKVIGKALVLDEIINYIQSLQRQVEFLSMKLEAITSGMNVVSIEGFPTKNFGMQTFDAIPGPPFVMQPTREYEPGSSSEWLHMQVGGSFERAT